MQRPVLLIRELAEVVQELLSEFQDLQLASVVCTGAKVHADGVCELSWVIVARR